jgi:hypothetical protein
LGGSPSTTKTDVDVVSILESQPKKEHLHHLHPISDIHRGISLNFMDHHIKCTTSATRTKSPGFPIHEVVADVFSFRGIANDLLSQATS